ncbi:MAG: hypothetical protein KC466_08995 [Myxococcales bacterium]|nr:hypothetical protein [Myxococcales bacterium]
MAERPAGNGSLITGLVLFFVVGTPMIAYVWHVLSDVLSGHVEIIPVTAAIALLLVFLVLLRFLLRFIERMGRAS